MSQNPKPIPTAADWKQLHDGVRQLIRAVPQARTALQELERAGCIEEWILSELYLYCGGSEEHLNISLKKVRRVSDQLWRISETLNREANVIEKTILHELDKERWEYESVFRVPSDLRLASSYLVIAYMTFRTRTFKKTGLNHHLLYLAYHVKIATGRARYKEIARLVSAVRGDANPNIKNLADSLRNKIKTCEKQDMEFYLEQKKLIQRYFEWHRYESSRTASGR